MGNNELELSAPWVTFAHELDKLFAEDPEVAFEYDEDQRKVKLFVESQEKADALTDILPLEKRYGSEKLVVEVVPANTGTKSLIDKYKTAFKGNPAVSYVDEYEVLGNKVGYVVFEPKIAQFFNDDISDPLGLCSELYADLAEHVFADRHDGIFFSTDLIGHYLRNSL